MFLTKALLCSLCPIYIAIYIYMCNCNCKLIINHLLCFTYFEIESLKLFIVRECPFSTRTDDRDDFRPYLSLKKRKEGSGK